MSFILIGYIYIFYLLYLQHIYCLIKTNLLENINLKVYFSLLIFIFQLHDIWTRVQVTASPFFPCDNQSNGVILNNN